MEGPQFSTLAESRLYRSWGMDIIGMTNLQEAKLAREAEICYTTIALVTDYDCWHPEHDHVTVEMIVANLMQNATTAQQVIAAAVERLPFERDCECASALKYAIITRPDAVPADLVRDGAQAAAERVCEAVVRRQPLPEERADAPGRAIDELIGEHQVHRRVLFLEAADGAR